jgi:hypothetical protein
MQKLLPRIGLFLFSGIWILALILLYFAENSWHLQSIQHFRYLPALLLLLALAGGMAFWLRRRPSRPAALPWLNGLSLLGASWLFALFVTFLHTLQNPQLQGVPGGYLQVSLYYLGLVAALYLILGVVFTLGDWLLQLFPMPMAGIERSVLCLGIGTLGLVFLLFLLGTLNLLYAAVLWPLLGIIILLNLPGAQRFVKGSLLQPIPLEKDLNFLGTLAFSLLAAYLSLNALQVIRPIPIGFDALNLYMQLPALTHDYHGLVAHTQPHNWSLFMSMGYLLFDRIEVTLALSYVAGPLSLLALYAIARRWLDVNHSLLSCLLFYSLPMVQFHSYQEMKIDLGLQFISLCILLLLLAWISPRQVQPPSQEAAAPEPIEPAAAPPAKKKTKRKSPKGKPRKAASARKSRSRTPKVFSLFPANFWTSLGEKLRARLPKSLQADPYWIWLGLFMGFALGTKLTSLFVFFPLLVVMWYVKGNARLSLGILCLSLAGVLLLGLDRQAGLRGFHLGVPYLQLALGLLGLGLLGWEGVKNRSLLLGKVRLSLVFSFFFILSISPWLLKNLSDSGEVSRSGLLFGKKAQPEITVQEIKATYEQSKQSRP